ncbi:hypothetical protein ABIC65_001041 [Sphingomonas trueperi]|uniref:hypothetical protein n=1 Tax=Sphingomonas trueperi TaxID=53317 RepID=UPI003398C4E8
MSEHEPMSLERAASSIRHALAHNLELKQPKGYSQTKTSGWLAAEVPDWQLRQWLSAIEGALSTHQEQSND